MNLQERVKEDMKSAMKSGDSLSVTVLRGLMAAFTNKAIEKKLSALEEGDAMAVLRTEAKKRKDSIEAFTSGNRSDLAEKEKKELAIIEKYLPAQLDGGEVFKRVKEILAQHPEAASLPLAMKAVMAELKDRADGKTVSEAVKKIFQPEN